MKYLERTAPGWFDMLKRLPKPLQQLLSGLATKLLLTMSELEDLAERVSQLEEKAEECHRHQLAAAKKTRASKKRMAKVKPKKKH